MFLPRYFLTLLGIFALQSTVYANLLNANDEETCLQLCSTCDGTANFISNVCHCHVAEDNQLGAECIGRIKRQAGELGLDVVSCDLADSEADRAARCIVTPPFRHFRSRDDADLIAKYFMSNGLAGFGSLLGSSKSKTDQGTLETKNSDTSSNAENVGAKMEGTETELGSDSVLVGASNPNVGSNLIPGQLFDMNSLLGAAGAWLNPNTLLAMRNGMAGQGSTLGSTHNDNYQMDSAQGNIVGSAHQNVAGDSSGMYDAYNSYPAGTIVGMSPYSYIVAAPNPAQLQNGANVSPMQSYMYNYNSMLGSQIPLVGGPSPYWNYPNSLVGANNPLTPGQTGTSETIQDQSANADSELIGEANPNQSLQDKKTTDSEDEEDELKTVSNEIKEPIVGSKQTAENSKDNETKQQIVSSLKQHTKQQLKRFKTKGTNAKTE